MKNGKFFKRYLLFFSCILIAGCKKENMCDCLKSTGEIITDRRTIPDFTELEVNKNVFITLYQDTVTYAEVEAGENLISLIKTDVNNGVLKITNENICNWVRSYKKEIHVRIHLEHLSIIRHYGSKDIRSANTLTNPFIDVQNCSSGDIHLSLNTLEAHTGLMFNSGDVYLDGYARRSYVFSQSFGFAYEKSLVNDSCSVDQRGQGDIYVSTYNWFGVNLADVGNVYYTGNPPIYSYLSGSGKLIHE